MAENIDLSLVLERLNELIADVRDLKAQNSDIQARVTSLQQNSATRSQFLALAETLNQFDSILAGLDARVAVIESRP